MAKRIENLTDVITNYDVVLCDVWGVIHNGVEAFSASCKALIEARQAGATIVLLTNSPRPSLGVVRQLRELHVPDEAYDRVVSSGDVTRHLVEHGPKNIFLMGPSRDLNFFDGLDINVVPAADAESIVCTGFFDDKHVPEDYTDILQAFIDRNATLICANPDLVVRKGNDILPCAGAIAAYYEQLGGTTSIAGKPHSPIYREALDVARQERGDFDTARVLAIGDGMLTDVRGALSQGLDLLYIAGGIHAAEYTVNGEIDDAIINAWLTRENVEPTYWMAELA